MGVLYRVVDAAITFFTPHFCMRFGVPYVSKDGINNRFVQYLIL